jgi:hypothetical protein
VWGGWHTLACLTPCWLSAKIGCERGDEPRWAEPIDLDASALIKLFVPEPESDELNTSLPGAENMLVSESHSPKWRQRFVVACVRESSVPQQHGG